MADFTNDAFDRMGAQLGARALLAEHACFADYDGNCVGCSCAFDVHKWRNSAMPDGNHYEHADHLAKLLYGDA